MTNDNSFAVFSSEILNEFQESRIKIHSLFILFRDILCHDFKYAKFRHAINIQYDVIIFSNISKMYK